MDFHVNYAIQVGVGNLLKAIQNFQTTGCFCGSINGCMVLRLCIYDTPDGDITHTIIASVTAL